jgi:hypothetical protein
MRTTRTLKLELLRHGPAHNQLLSPLTQYLALCGNHGAGTIHLPLEHREFLLRLRPLRYQHPSPPDEAVVRGAQLREFGQMLSDLLAKVPGLGTELGACFKSREELVHLQLVTSAAELALLPFEAALAPQGVPGAGAPLALQTELPLSITRQVRRSSPAQPHWRRKPRILMAFASLPGYQEVPYQAHIAALFEAIAPWIRPSRREPDNSGDLLKVLPYVSLKALQEECSRHEYTHVHILAHGISQQDLGGERFVLLFHDDSSPQKASFVTGENLVQALRGHQRKDGQLSHPAVATIASCDSGNVGSLIVPGGSLAHVLHENGIPFVVASQFPLTFTGSVVLTRGLYSRLLWGEDPRVILHDVRQQLRLLGESSIDWASVVAYASFSQDFDEQLTAAQFASARLAANAALARTDRIIKAYLERTGTEAVSPSADAWDAEQVQQKLSELEQGRKRLYIAKRRLRRVRRLEDSRSRSICAEIEGLCASIDKRLAFNRHVEFQMTPGGPEPKKLVRVRQLLERARAHYQEGFRLDPNMHWLGAQYVSLTVVLEKKVPLDWFTSARLAARLALRSGTSEDRAWAHSNMAELCLLRALHPLFKREVTAEDPEVAKWVQRGLAHIQWMLKLVKPQGFQVHSSREQYRRYVEWWFRDKEWVVPQGLARQFLKALGDEQEPLPDDEEVDEGYIR